MDNFGDKALTNSAKPLNKSLSLELVTFYPANINPFNINDLFLFLIKSVSYRHQTGVVKPEKKNLNIPVDFN